jgi:putative heme-binding domain-containing protein
MQTPTIDLSTTDGQIQALKNPAINVRYAAVQKLKEQGVNATEAVKKLLEDRNPYIQARAIWLLPANELEKLLSHENEILRATVYRALRQKVADIIPYAEKMVNGTSDFIRREVAVSLTDVAYDKKKALLLKVIERDSDKWMLGTIATALDKHEADIYPEIKNIYKDKSEEYAWLLHPVNAIDDLNRIAADSSLATEKRIKALTGLGFVKDKRSLPAIKRLITSSDTMVAKSAKFWLEFLSPGSVKQEEVTLPLALTNATGAEKQYNLKNIVALKPDNKNGEQIFASYCRACHKAGKEGSTVAPNLTFITKKFDDTQLLNAIIFPGAAIAFGYESWKVETKGKKSFYGFMISDNKESMIIRDIAGQNHTINKSDIISLKKQDKSIMPSASQMNLSEQQLADVVGYLKSVAN